ncbi:MAG: VanZ family protein [bacterium]|nr:VanZ family protein [bacterium]
MPEGKHSVSYHSVANAYLPVVLWASLIFYLSAQSILPGFYVETYDFIFKKIAHITVYAILYFLLYRSQLITSDATVTEKRVWLLPFFLVLLYAVSDEVHQNFVAGRFGTARDVGFDMLGASLAFLKLYRYI